MSSEPLVAVVTVRTTTVATVHSRGGGGNLLLGLLIGGFCFPVLWLAGFCFLGSHHNKGDRNMAWAMVCLFFVELIGGGIALGVYFHQESMDCISVNDPLTSNTYRPDYCQYSGYYCADHSKCVPCPKPMPSTISQCIDTAESYTDGCISACTTTTVCNIEYFADNCDTDQFCNTTRIPKHTAYYDGYADVSICTPCPGHGLTCDNVTGDGNSDCYNRCPVSTMNRGVISYMNHTQDTAVST